MSKVISHKVKSTNPFVITYELSSGAIIDKEYPEPLTEKEIIEEIQFFDSLTFSADDDQYSIMM